MVRLLAGREIPILLVDTEMSRGEDCARHERIVSLPESRSGASSNSEVDLEFSHIRSDREPEAVYLQQNLRVNLFSTPIVLFSEMHAVL